MRTFCEPPLPDWRLASRSPSDRAVLAEVVARRARRLGTGELDPARPVIATGHQAWLWHPGILAKDIAMDVAAQRHAADRLHLVVDQDVHDALVLTLPRQQGSRLSTARLRLASQRLSLPTGFQEPADAAEVLRVLDEAGGPGVERIAAAFADLPACRSLAEQMSVVLNRLMRPAVGEVPLLFVSDLPELPGYRRILETMLHDAGNCVAAYNRAVAGRPDAGIARLIVERERVELPLWACRWGQPRRRVYADLADSEDPIFVDEAGEPVDSECDLLLPRALLLTATMRRLGCDLFIHGRGGGVYDEITDVWWAEWGGEPLAPNAVVSADLYLEFDAPVADRADLERGVWYARYVRHNVDRVLGLDEARARQKRRLIEQASGGGGRTQRWLAFREIQRFNRELAAAYPQSVREARERLELARIGVGNARVAGRRDWCFALYSAEQLQTLRQAFAEAPAAAGC